MAVVCGGCELCRPNYAIHRSSFPYYSVEFVARGKGGLVLDGHSHRLVTGSVFSYGPNIAQDITTDADEPLLKYFVNFTGTTAVELLKQCGLVPGSEARVFAPGKIQAVFENLIDDGLKGTGMTADLCCLGLKYLLLKIPDSRAPSQTGLTRAYSTYQRCRRHIEENCQRLRSLEQIARECKIDQAYLCRLFRRYEQQTPYRLLMRLKMNLAAGRLQTSGILIKQVAAELDFDDPFHFSRAFKSVFGLSPEAFRRLR